MTTNHNVAERAHPTGEGARAELLSHMPVHERRLTLAGVSTSVLEGGDGPPVVLLHGLGEFAAGWLRVIPDLVSTHHVIAPDLPGHGASDIIDGRLDTDRMLAWLGELIETMCDSRPALVGRVLGGAIAARYAAVHGDRLSRLVLVDTLGLAPFEPEPAFALALDRFSADPTEPTFEGLMRECAFDFDGVREQLGSRWDPLAAYAVDQARTPSVQAALGSLMGELVLAAIPRAELERITVPTTLIWGRHDRATPLAVAEEASTIYGWPVHVIDHAADDPGFDQPAAFLRALRPALGLFHNVIGG